MPRLNGSTNLDPEVDNIIRARVQLCGRLGMRIDRETLAVLLEQDIMNQGYRPPSIENIKKKISAAQHSQDDPLGKPWSLSSMAEYHIPSEALPTVMEAYKKRLANNDVLTIREALWMGRLYGVIEPKDLVYDWAFFYALNEQLYEDFGKRPFTDLDLELINDVYHARREMRTIELWQIAEKYGDDPDKLKELNLPQEEIDAVISVREEQNKLYKELEEEAQNERKHKAKKQE
jgi:hypothetical protein